MKFLRYDLIETARDTTEISRVTGSFYGNSTINYCSILLQLWTSCIQGTVTVNFYLQSKKVDPLIKDVNYEFNWNVVNVTYAKKVD